MIRKWYPFILPFLLHSLRMLSRTGQFHQAMREGGNLHVSPEVMAGHLRKIPIYAKYRTAYMLLNCAFIYSIIETLKKKQVWGILPNGPLLLITAIFIMSRGGKLHVYANLHCAFEVTRDAKLARPPFTYPRSVMSLRRAPWHVLLNLVCQPLYSFLHCLLILKVTKTCK